MRARGERALDNSDHGASLSQLTTLTSGPVESARRALAGEVSFGEQSALRFDMRPDWRGRPGVAADFRLQ
jgi:hypothetical protein